MNGFKKTDWDAVLSERDRNQKWLEDRFDDLDYPELYLGDEMNTFHFDWDDAVLKNQADDTFRVVFMNMTPSNFTFASPAVMLFYDQLHEYEPSWVVERSLCPPTAVNRKLMAEDGIRPFAVESKIPVACFDAVCMSMDLTDTAVSVPWLLLESGMPVNAADRGQGDPFIIMGGSALNNPAPFSPFCDIIIFGEGEDILPPLLSLIQEGKRHGRSREDILLDASGRWDCVYVPRFYEERFGPDGKLLGTFPLRQDVPGRVRFHYIADLDQTFISSRPFLNFSTYALDTAHYEISRSCEGKCSFCMPCFTSLPFRARSADLVRENTEKIIYNTGNTSVLPVSFNSVSHPEINRIVSDLTDRIGDRVKLVSLRVDGFHDNPELCCFISMQKSGRVAFGVEGASQRLRDMMSKNLSEEQILDTMHAVCRNGFHTVKFMMIAGLPGETEADLDELFELASKIKDIFMQEIPAGRKMPKLMISWTPLRCFPHTPLQWARFEQHLLPYYADFAEKIQDLGFRTYVPEVTVDDMMSQLFARGDSRLSDLLLCLAREGDLKHTRSYGKEVLEKTVRFLKDNGLPPLEEWFREYSPEDPLPWDIVESPATRRYLYKRYLDMKQPKPASDPICSARCSGCGACDEEQKLRIRAMPARREADRMIDLHHPVKKQAFVPAQHVLLEYDFDRLHSTVVPSYWDCEIRRALFHAGIDYDPDSVESFDIMAFSDRPATGFNMTNISLGRHYDPDELKDRIEENALNFHVRCIKETERPVRVTSVTYSMHLPAGADMEELPSLLRSKLAEKEWPYRIQYQAVNHSFYRNLRMTVQDLDIQDGNLLITMGPVFTDPRMIYRYIFGIPHDTPLVQVPERIDFTYEEKGVLDLALTRKLRDSYLRYLESRTSQKDRTFEYTAAYISGRACTSDLKRLISGDQSVLKKGDTSALLLDLIDFAGKTMENETM